MPHPVRDGKIYTRTLEYSAAYTCNLRCADCLHLTPYTTTPLPSLDSFTADLERLGGAMHTLDFRLLGGEPLLNPDLTEMARRVRESGIADIVSVTTNGILLHKMDERLWDQIDTLRVTLYPEASPSAATLERVAEAARATNTKLCLTPRPSFQAVALTEAQPDDLLARLLYFSCQAAHVCQYAIFGDGRLFKCALPLGMPEYLRQIGDTDYDGAADGLDLHAGGDLLARIRQFFADPTPPRSCRYCLGYAGIDQPHRQLTRAELDDPTLRPVTRGTHLHRLRLLRHLGVRAYGLLKFRLTGVWP